ncbi:MAG: LemA family protein [Candidatus Dependentiae bacterium]|nr:LemA family protein [Candidatus Dependentiae bacterium]
MNVTLLIILGIVALVALWVMGAYNGLVRLKALVDEGWSGIDVQLKRRYDLIPNLVAVVKQYSIHEKEVLENVTRMRASAMSAQTVSQKEGAEQGLTSALKTLFAVAENYPNLKANESFLQLQQQLVNLEHEIQLGRRYYNGAARNYNVSVASFPSNIIANMFGFAKAAYFEILSHERETPKVDFK